MYHNFLIHSSVDGHLGSSHVLATVYSAAVNNGIHVSFSTLVNGSDSKASAHNVGDLGSIPGLGRSLGEGNGNPLQYKSHGRGSLVGLQFMGSQRVGHN